MATPVRAGQGQNVATPENHEEADTGSYPAEITREQFEWLQQRAADRRREWVKHAESVAHNQKS